MDGFAVPMAPPKRQRTEEDVDAMDIDSEEVADMQIDFDELDFDEAELDELLEQTPVVDELDVKSLRKACLRFEKAITANQEQRLRFKDKPEMFMKSEMELDEAIQQLAILGTDGGLYPTFVEIGCVPSLLSVLLHENTDIALDVIELLVDLTEPSIFSDQPNAAVLLDAIVEHGGLQYLVENLKRLDPLKEEDGKGIYRTLTVVENVCEIRPEMADSIVEQSALVQYLVDRIAHVLPAGIDAVTTANMASLRMYCSEILSILTQNSKQGQKTLLKGRRFETILTVLAAFRKRDPATVEEEEVVENLFNCICCCLLESRGQEKFLQLDGIHLMLIFVRKRMFCKKSALKVLDYALLHDQKSCESFVMAFGLKTLFGAFMKREDDGKKQKKKKKKKKAYAENEQEDEEHIVSCITSLFHYTTGSRRVRLLHKFVEDNCAKTERLAELHEKYSQLVGNCDKDIAAIVNYRNNAYEDYDAEEDRPEFEIMRLDAGLSILQLTDVAIAYVLLEGSLEAKHHLLEQLSMANCSLRVVSAILHEYLDSYFLLTDDDEEFKRITRELLVKLLARFDVECEAAASAGE